MNLASNWYQTWTKHLNLASITVLTWKSWALTSLSTGSLACTERVVPPDMLCHLVVTYRLYNNCFHFSKSRCNTYISPETWQTFSFRLSKWNKFEKVINLISKLFVILLFNEVSNLSSTIDSFLIQSLFLLRIGISILKVRLPLKMLCLRTILIPVISLTWFRSIYIWAVYYVFCLNNALDLGCLVLINHCFRIQFSESRANSILGVLL